METQLLAFGVSTLQNSNFKVFKWLIYEIDIVFKYYFVLLSFSWYAPINETWAPVNENESNMLELAGCHENQTSL